MAKREPRLDDAMVAALGRGFAVRVQPGASGDAVAVDEADGTLRLKVAVTAAPEGGKANAAVLKLVGKAIGVAPTRLAITRGETSRDKWLEIRD